MRSTPDPSQIGFQALDPLVYVHAFILHCSFCAATIPALLDSHRLRLDDMSDHGSDFDLGRSSHLIAEGLVVMAVGLSDPLFA